MKIVYICQYFTTRSMPGGTRAYEQARRLVERGHDVEVITTDSAARSASTSWRVTVEDGIRIHWLSVPYTNHMTFAHRLRAFFWFAALASPRSARIKADVVFASSTPLTVAIPGVIAARARRSRFVFEVRDLWPEVPVEMGALQNPVAVKLAYALARTAYRNADRVVALSDGMADGVVRHGYPRERIVVAPNAADIDLFDVDPREVEQFRRSRSWLQDRPLIAYIGTFGRVNGVEYLVRVAAEMDRIAPDVRFLLVGDGAEFETVRSTADELGVLDRSLFVLPSVPKADVPAMFGAATIATSTTIPVPALEANSANKFFDALAAGAPQAINYGGWQADVLRDSGAGLVLDPHDAAAAARMLAAAVRDREWLSAAGQAARRLGVERYSRDGLFALVEAAVTGRAAVETARQDATRPERTPARSIESEG